MDACLRDELNESIASLSTRISAGAMIRLFCGIQQTCFAASKACGYLQHSVSMVNPAEFVDSPHSDGMHPGRKIRVQVRDE